MNTFSLILVIATLVTGVLWLYDFKFKRPQRIKTCEQRAKEDPSFDKKQRKQLMEPSGFLGQLASLFPIVIIVFVIRSFIIEPFRIPSGSMMPTLLAGDFIAVTKYSCGIRNPLTNEVWIETSTPQLGDVIVFKYPEDPKIDYIKRVVGMPGDTITYRNKRLYVRHGDSPVAYEITQKGLYTEENLASVEKYIVFDENLGGKIHEAMVNPLAPEFTQYYYRQDGELTGTWKVPEGHYFVMGDNRDNSRDSRFWGFVPMENVIGKTVGIWLSLEFDGNTDSFLPSWIPSKVRFERLGGIN